MQGAEMKSRQRVLCAQIIVLMTMIGSMSACSSFSLHPWVKPYERNQLADPIMSFNRDPVSLSYLHHVREVREGARGAEGGDGGGCGCN